MNDKIKRALSLLIQYDRYLLQNNLSERSITHRLGMYLQVIYPRWHVDCEFNKNLDAAKGADFDPAAFLSLMADVLEEDSRIGHDHRVIPLLRQNEISFDDIVELKRQLREPGRIEYNDELDAMTFMLTEYGNREFHRFIYPDIIIHKRGTTNNHIVIEAKKSSNQDRMARAFDLVKLITLVIHPNYNYKRGYFIDIPTIKDSHDRLTSHKEFMFMNNPLEERVYKVFSVSS